jgi:hypothetical protein
MQNDLIQTTLVGAGGFVVAGLRFLVSGFVCNLVPNAVFPWRTLHAAIEEVRVRFYRVGKMEAS